MERMYFLALPTIQALPKIKDPLKVSARALTYRITKRTERLAALKKRPEIQLRMPGAVSPSAMKTIGSIRTFIQSLISCFIARNPSPISRPIFNATEEACRLYRFAVSILLHAIGFP